MKKILIASIIFMLSCFCIISNAVVTNSSEYSNEKVYVFYEENNENYEKEKQWLEENPNIRKEYVNISENGELLNKVKDALKIKKDKLPLTVIGSNYLIGFDEKTQNKINEIIENYKTSGEYTDIVEKIRNGEDVKELVKTNKPNGIAKTILIIIGIILVVCILIEIKNKKTVKARH